LVLLVMAQDFQPAGSAANLTDAGCQVGPNQMITVGPEQVITLTSQPFIHRSLNSNPCGEQISLAPLGSSTRRQRIARAVRQPNGPTQPRIAATTIHQ